MRFEPLALCLVGAGAAWLVAENLRRLRKKRAPDTAVAAPGVANGEFADGSGTPVAHGGSGVDPLLIGFAGLGLGATLAFMLPSTRGERDAIACAREELWDEAEALGRSVAARLRDLGSRSTATPAPPPPDE